MKLWPGTTFGKWLVSTARLTRIQNKGWCYDASLMYEFKILQNERLTTPLFCTQALRTSLECEIGTAVEQFHEKNNNVKPACHKIYQGR